MIFTSHFRKHLVYSFVVWVGILFVGVEGYAQTVCQKSESQSGVQKPGLQSGGGSGGTVMPDLFTGTMSYSIPIEVPPGRKGMDPGLALTYRSSNGNGVVGMGWEMEVGAIERSTKCGVNYGSDDYVFRMAGAASL